VSFAAAELRHALEANAAAIREAERLHSSLSEQIEEIGDARGRLNALPPALAEDVHPALLGASRQHQANEKEGNHAAVVLRLLDDVLTVVRDLPGRMRTPSAESDGTASQNVKILASINDELTAARDDLQAGCEELELRLLAKRARVQELWGELEAAHVRQKAEFDRYQAANLATSQAIRQRHEREQDVIQLTGVEAQRAEAAATVVRLRQGRGELRGKYLLQREQITRLREGTALRLQTEAGNKVRIQIHENADTQAYQQRLLDGLKGAGVRNHEDIIQSLLRIRPEELAQLVRDGDAVEFEQQCGLGAERSKKILQAFTKNLDPYSLELMLVDDLVRIELNVATNGEAYFKDAADLSAGQKCTALLPILLARRDAPLIVDQPEDNLDNHFIYETIVECVRRLKTRRQMVFVTHNANIPVLGEADQVIVLNSDGKRGYVEKQGSLDDCRQEIIDLLEGGEEAFDLRRRRYGKS
jgi:hypothetical protein